MTFFRKNQWGTGSDLDYKKLNSMSQNDLAIKEKVDRAAKGIICWQYSNDVFKGSTQGNTTATPPIITDWTPHPAFTDIKFTVGEDRFINIVFRPKRLKAEWATPTTPEVAGIQIDLQLTFLFDGVPSPNDYMLRSSVPTGYISPMTFSPTASAALSAGEHIVSVVYRTYDNYLQGVNFEIDGGELAIYDLGRREI